MKSLSRELLGPLGKSACFALLAAFLLAPRPVLAGCNDHVRSAGPHPWRSAQLDALLRGDLPAEMTTSDDPAPGRQRPPTCSGPSCSNNVPAPLSSGVQPDLGPHRGESLLPPVPVLPPSASQAFLAFDEPLDATFPTSRVFHPPRPIV
ncbi:MAG: hypothetical protein P4L85_03450 [Paludisphaera borealis]|uniref:hypothetical protein n=1 Tax=Paludisphaera borealis TaxID=1387353 RepID=UPI002845AAEF|nr:hypothetical protein [Paludisphaera borealis]MDR3618381.1 hypothetical protein [Paludisphaera borealis]